jgi:hypothetical protein
MQHSEYDRRRSALEKQYHEDLELIRAGYHAKLQALEMLLLASPAAAGEASERVPSVGGEGRVEPEDQKPAPEETRPRSGTQGIFETQGVETKSPERARSVPLVPRGGLRQMIQDVLPQLPEIFTRHDLEKALGFAPRRSTVVTILEEMCAAKELVIAELSLGRRLTRYRKVTGQG